ncbi:unnamed protein product, partial [Prorocentrum cordatum]
MTVCPELRPERPRPPPIFDLRLGGAEAAHCAYTGNFGVASASRPAVTDAIGQLVEGFGASGLLPHENSAGAEAEALGAEVPRSRWAAAAPAPRGPGCGGPRLPLRVCRAAGALGPRRAPRRACLQPQVLRGGPPPRGPMPAGGGRRSAGRCSSWRATGLTAHQTTPTQPDPKAP